MKTTNKTFDTEYLEEIKLQFKTGKIKSIKPKELQQLGLLYGTPSLVTLYNMLWDGRLKYVDTGGKKKSNYGITKEHVNEFNRLAEQGKLPEAKKRPNKQPTRAVS